MSSEWSGKNRQEQKGRRLQADASRQANAEEMLAELKRLLESAERPPFGSQRSMSSGLTAGEPQQTMGFSAEALDPYGRQQDPTDRSTPLGSRRLRLAASGVALGLAALAVAGLALKLAAPSPKSPLPVEPAQAQSPVKPGAELGVGSSAGGPLVKFGAPPDSVHGAGAEAGSSAAASTPGTPASIDPQAPAVDPHAAAGATMADTPAPASSPARNALTDLPAASPEPAPSVSSGPDRTPIVAPSVNSPKSKLLSEAPKPPAAATKTAGVKGTSAKPPSMKVSATANAGKAPAKKVEPKSGKAAAGAIAEGPKRALAPLPPEKPAESSAAQAATEPVAAAPTPPPTFAAQSVGQLTHALGYLTHLPAELLQHVRDPNTEPKQ